MAVFSPIVLLAFHGSSFAQATLLDDASTSVSAKSADSNFGTNPNLSVNSAANVYIKFKLSTVLPSGTPGSRIERATLKLYLGNVTSPGKLDIYPVAGPWNEDTITARNAPALGNLLTTTKQIELAKRHEFLVIDITSLVQQWLGDDGQGTNGSSNYGLAIVAHPTDATTPEVANVTFDSKENSQTSHEAQLDLQLSAAAGPPGGGGTVTEVSGNGPITVTNPTTTPTISLSVVPAVNGGTGLDSTGAPGNFLRSTGGSWTSAPLSAADVPDLGTNYIRNATALQSLSNFNISGTGTANIFTAGTQFNIGNDRVLTVTGTFEKSNIFAGIGAGASNQGDANSFFGINSGTANTQGDQNSFFGFATGASNTTGQDNSFFGSFAGHANTSGRGNAFFGKEAGAANINGNGNSFFGFGAGLQTSEGSDNTFVGSHAGTFNTSGFANSFFGTEAGSHNATGSNLTIIGANANVAGSNLSFATAIGAGAFVDTSNTIVLGRPQETVRVPGALNVDGTFGANVLNATTQFNIDGNRILTSAGTNNLFAGAFAGGSNTTGNANAFFGKNAGQANTTGASNSFVGYNAGAGNTTGTHNSFFGDAAGFVNGSANDNSFFGFLAGFHSTASENSFFGSLAGADSTTGTANSFFGSSAGVHNTTGFVNSFFGRNAGAFNKEGGANSFFGESAGVNNTSGSSNSFFGRDSGFFNTTGNSNVFIGLTTGLGNTAGSNNTLVGAQANVAANSLAFATALGAGAVVNSSNTVVLGRNVDTVRVPGALNVAGAFAAGIVAATTQFSLGGQRILSNAGTDNLFAGTSAGDSNTTGGFNSFFGVGVGTLNTTGEGNSLFGRAAGGSNTTGNSNSFFGVNAGSQNTTGNANVFFGVLAGLGNTAGSNNTFIGVNAGTNNVGGSGNTFLGRDANFNFLNQSGNANTLLGTNAKIGAADLNNATAIGAGAVVSTSNTVVLGRSVDAVKVPGRLSVTAVILKSPGGACFELTVTDSGALVTNAVPCP